MSYVDLGTNINNANTHYIMILEFDFKVYDDWMKTRTNYCKYLVIYIYTYIYTPVLVPYFQKKKKKGMDAMRHHKIGKLVPYNNPSGFVVFLLLYMNRYDHAMRHHKIEKLTHSITLLVLLFHIYIYKYIYSCLLM